MKQPDPSDDPLDLSADDWEERVREILTGDDADPEVVELGREMARDAIRVTKGELSDAEFDARYRHRVQEVFEDMNDIDADPEESKYD